MANRKSGILLHPSSLPSAFGVGDFGQAANSLFPAKYQRVGNKKTG